MPKKGCLTNLAKNKVPEFSSDFGDLSLIDALHGPKTPSNRQVYNCCCFCFLLAICFSRRLNWWLNKCLGSTRRMFAKLNVGFKMMSRSCTQNPHTHTCSTKMSHEVLTPCKWLVWSIWEPPPSNFSTFHSQMVPRICKNRREKDLARIFSSIAHKTLR